MKHPPLAKLMKEKRKVLGVSLRKVAKAAGVHHLVVWRMEKGYEVGLTNGMKVLRVLEIRL